MLSIILGIIGSVAIFLFNVISFSKEITDIAGQKVKTLFQLKV